MQLDNYFSSDKGHILFSREQASDFAKGVAGDFNPIHDIDSKRFCVPGDLLFSLALRHYGLSQQMRVTFSGMVGDSTPLSFPSSDRQSVDITDADGKTYLSLQRNGQTSHEPELIEAITRRYVQFSGQTFPHILVPLMAERQIMINTERPLVIYESMSIELEHLDFSEPELLTGEAKLDFKGKRGDAHLHFSVMADGRQVGRGEKIMLLSGLRPYEQSKIDTLVSSYMAEKDNYRTRYS